MRCYVLKSITIVSLMLITVIFILPTSNVFSQTRDITIVINGESINIPTDRQPVIINNRALVPLYPTFELLGYSIELRELSRNVILSRPENTVLIGIGGDAITFTSNGDPVATEVPAQLINGHIMIPLRAVSESSELTVQWHSESSTIYITGTIPERDPVPTIERMIYDISLDITPEELRDIMAERGFYAGRSYTSDVIVDHLGGFSFSYDVGGMWFYFNSSGTLERMVGGVNRTPNDIGIGDTKERVIEVYGNNFRLSPFGSNMIEYFDGETYLNFSFARGDGIVTSWGIGPVSADENFLRHFGI